jgi:hypothetical protein
MAADRCRKAPEHSLNPGLALANIFQIANSESEAHDSGGDCVSNVDTRTRTGDTGWKNVLFSGNLATY